MKSLLVACLLMLAGATTYCAEPPAMVNGIVAIVNDRVITVKDVYWVIRQEMDFLERRYANQPKVRDERINALKAEAIEGLVEHYLVLQEFATIARPLPESY